MSHRFQLTKIAAATVLAFAPALGAQAVPTRSVPIQKEPMTTYTSGGEVALTPWTLPADQFNADLEPIMVPTNCAAVVDRADVARIAISSQLYQPGMITPDSAKFLAVCTIPGQVTSGEMHQENGRTMYEVTLIPDGKTVNAKVIVDANSGQVLSSKTYGGLRGLAGYLRENVEREQNKNNAALDTLNMTNRRIGTITPPPGVVCTLEARPAIQLSLLDENGMMLPAGSNVRVIATTGSFSDSTTVMTNGSTSFPLGWERPGTYSIQVNVDGYAPATISDIMVGTTSNGCHVETRHLTAQLHR